MLGPGPANPPRIFLRPARVAQLLGVELPWQSLESYLVAIGATLVSKPEDGRIAVEVPELASRPVREIDLIEEVARLHGYENFPADLGRSVPAVLPDAADRARGRRACVVVSPQGLFEVPPLPTAPADGSRQRSPGSTRCPAPMATCAPAASRAGAAGGGATGHSRSPDVRLFEIGNGLRARRRPGERPAEERHVAAVLTGRREPPHWTGNGAGSDRHVGSEGSFRGGRRSGGSGRHGAG